MDLQPGDIFATRGTGIAGWAVRNLITPGTDRFHYGLLWRKYADDWIILESVFPKGVSVGLLSRYSPDELKFYRVYCREAIRRRAPMRLVRHGRAIYDVFLPVKMALSLVSAYARYWLSGQFRKVHVQDIPYVRDSLFVCTEAVHTAYLELGVGIASECVAPIPNSFREAEILNRLKEITE